MARTCDGRTCVGELRRLVVTKGGGVSAQRGPAIGGRAWGAAAVGREEGASSGGGRPMEV